MTSQMTPGEARRRAANQRLAKAWGGSGWTQARADIYAQATTTNDPADHEWAVDDLLRTWTRHTIPPPAEINQRAEQRRQHRHRTIPRHHHTGGPTLRTILGRHCTTPDCDGSLTLTTTPSIWCSRCNTTQPHSDPDTGTTTITLTNHQVANLRLSTTPPVIGETTTQHEARASTTTSEAA